VLLFTPERLLEIENPGPGETRKLLLGSHDLSFLKRLTDIEWWMRRSQAASVLYPG
jgi:hypothetical protein